MNPASEASEAGRRELRLTADGSHTLYVPSLDEHYHSSAGAIQESRHVFIQAGLHQLSKPRLRLLEVGFGTGLNALLTLLETEKESGLALEYFAVERYPLPDDCLRMLNYAQLLCPEREALFSALHTAAWDRPASISERFILHKIQGDIRTCPLPEAADLIYYDAFAPGKQAGMWTQEIFDRLYRSTAKGGLLTTYCAKGEVRRIMQKAGYSVERIPGPPGKREMLRACRRF
jgi:tRNA U34 5-methylaminomethyl-2-thiouridine-forming methyltransferase MnmC